MSEEKRPEWMTSIASNVNPEDYLLGRKIDKTFELSQKEKAEKAREARIELIAKDKIKLSDDPLLDLERRRRELKIQIIQNPVLLKHFRDRLLKETRLGRKQSSDGTDDIKPNRQEEGLSNPKRRRKLTDDSYRHRESEEHRYKHGESRYQRSPASHRDLKARDRDSQDPIYEDDKSSSRPKSSHHRSRHSDSRPKQRSSYRSRSRSISPSSRHGHRHRHHDRRDRSRSTTSHRRS